MEQTKITKKLSLNRKPSSQVGSTSVSSPQEFDQQCTCHCESPPGGLAPVIISLCYK